MSFAFFSLNNAERYDLTFISVWEYYEDQDRLSYLYWCLPSATVSLSLLV